VEPVGVAVINPGERLSITGRRGTGELRVGPARDVPVGQCGHDIVPIPIDRRYRLMVIPPGSLPIRTNAHWRR
jgi:hypothetical protein